MHIDSPYLYARYQKDNSFNFSNVFLPPPTMQKQPKIKLSFLVYKINLFNGKLVFEDERLTPVFNKTIQDLNIGLGLKLPAEIDFLIQGKLLTDKQGITKLSVDGKYSLFSKELNAKLNFINLIISEFNPYLKTLPLSIASGSVENSDLDLKLKENTISLKGNLFAKETALQDYLSRAKALEEEMAQLAGQNESISAELKILSGESQTIEKERSNMVDALKQYNDKDNFYWVTSAGLVVITPAAAVVQPLGALFLGAASTVTCFYALRLKIKLGYDDTLDCFGIHGVGSALGVLLLSFFIRDSWMASASEAAGRTWTVFDQLLVQLKGLGATILLAGVATIILCIIVEKTVGFRIDKEMELMGLDQALHGERGYDFS